MFSFSSVNKRLSDYWVSPVKTSTLLFKTTVLHRDKHLFLIVQKTSLQDAMNALRINAAVWD